MYPSWKQIGAATGRMACAEPNLQAIPHGSGHHSCVRAPEGRVLVKADYSQIELQAGGEDRREEPSMLETYREGGDVHTMTAKSITGKEEVTKEERKLAKAVNFGLIFGQGAEGSQGLRQEQLRRRDDPPGGGRLPHAVLRDLPGHRTLARGYRRQARPRAVRHPHA